jgi:hypothetical protein
MKSSDRQLQQTFVRATDEVIPPAPWLEDQIVDALNRRAWARRRTLDFGALGGLGSGVRLAAGVVALLIAVGTVAALLMSPRLLHSPTAPGNRSTTVQTPKPIQTVPFAPSPAVRASNWPPGGPVPAQLAGAWQPPVSASVCRWAGVSGCTLYLGLNNFQLGDEHPDDATNQGTIGPALFGNVVVNGSEIDFMSDECLVNGGFGFVRFTYTLNGNILVLARAPGPGESNCTWFGPSVWPNLAGTYTRVATP